MGWFSKNTQSSDEDAGDKWDKAQEALEDMLFDMDSDDALYRQTQAAIKAAFQLGQIQRGLEPERGRRWGGKH